MTHQDAFVRYMRARLNAVNPRPVAALSRLDLFEAHATLSTFSFEEWCAAVEISINAAPQPQAQPQPQPDAPPTDEQIEHDNAVGILALKAAANMGAPVTLEDAAQPTP